MKYLALAFALLAPSLAQAKDVALILNDNEVTALKQMLDAATKAQGLAVAGTAVYLLDKINKAPTVTDKKDVPAEEHKPAENHDDAH